MNYNDGTYTPRPPMRPLDLKDKFKHKKTLILIIAVVLILIIGSTCWYTVDDKQQGVVITFGKVTATTDAGIHFKLPLGIQTVEKVEVNVYQKIEIGYRSDDNYYASDVYIENESKMITGDYNIVNVDFFVEYKISDPVKYLYNSREPELVLKNLVQSQIRNVIGSGNVEEILTSGKSVLQSQIRDLVIGILEDYDIGLTLTDVKIQDSEPPTRDVIEAFKAVETAKQGAETAINQANAYKNAQLPLAQAEADKLIQNAEYLRQKRINEAKEQVAMFNAMYEQFALNPEITRIRMYYETLIDIMPDVKLYINTSSDGGSTQMLLPLESFVSAAEQNAQ